jgi:UDP-galactopyranose mutase
MFEKMLDSPRIKIMLNCDYKEIQKEIPFREMIYTGPVDSFFDYRYGKLPYRSLEFKHETHDVEVFQEAPVVNYPSGQPYTRVTEFKYLTGQVHKKTGIVYEYPKAEGDPYYPIPRAENAELYKKYETLAKARSDVHFVGRLATYKYYNMDQIVAQALTVYGKIEGLKRKEAAAISAPTSRVIYTNGNGAVNGNGSGVSTLDTVS